MSEISPNAAPAVDQIRDTSNTHAPLSKTLGVTTCATFWELIPNVLIHLEHFAVLDGDSRLGQKTIPLETGLKINVGLLWRNSHRNSKNSRFEMGIEQRPRRISWRGRSSIPVNSK